MGNVVLECSNWAVNKEPKASDDTIYYILKEVAVALGNVWYQMMFILSPPPPKILFNEPPY